MNLVIVCHPGSVREFVFQVPVNHTVHEGDFVMVDTKNGEKLGICQSEIFTANGLALKILLDRFHTNEKKMKHVIGVMKQERWV